MKTINKIILLSLACLAALVSCKKPMEEITGIDYDRVFTPAKIKATAAQTTVLVEWEMVVGVSEYVVQIAQDSLIFGIILNEYTTDSLRMTITDLMGSKQYSVRVKSVSDKDGQDDSKWNAVAFKTTAEQIMNEVDLSTVTKSTATVTWQAGAAATFLRVRPGDAPYIDIDLEPADLAAGEKQLTGLTPSTDYTVDIYNGSDNRRGRVTFSTTYIPTGDNVITLNIGDNLKDVMQDPNSVDKIIYLPSGFSYTIGGVVTPAGNMTIYGDPEGPKAQIISSVTQALNLPLTADSIVFVNMSITHQTAAGGQYFINMGTNADNGTTVQNLIFENCYIADFGRSFIRMQGSGSNQKIENLVFSNCIVENMGNQSGQNYSFIQSNNDMAKFGKITLKNSTFNTISPTSVFMRLNAPNPIVDMIDINSCTFYNVAGTGNYFIDCNANGNAVITINNSILGKTWDATSRDVRNGKGTTSADNTYKTTDWVTVTDTETPPTWINIPGTTAYSGSATDLFTNPATGNFKIKDNTFAGKATAGDPRWR